MIDQSATRLAPWSAELRRLWSLSDMIEFYGPSFVGSWMTLFQMSDHLRGSLIDPEQAARPVSAEDRAYIHRLVDELEKATRSLGMTNASLAARLLSGRVAPSALPCFYGALATGLESFLSQMWLEFSEQRFVFIPTDRHKYFQDDGLLWLELPSRMPSIDKDVREAGNAFAVGLYTATVFHLMRVAEICLRAFAKHLRVRLPSKKGPIEWAQWEDILKACRLKIEKLSQRAGSKPDKSANRAFYRGLLAEFEGFKDMYRNDVMHVRAVYGRPEAESAIEKVGSFVQRLTTRIHE